MGSGLKSQSSTACIAQPRAGWPSVAVICANRWAASPAVGLRCGIHHRDQSVPVRECHARLACSRGKHNQGLGRPGRGWERHSQREDGTSLPRSEPTAPACLQPCPAHRSGGSLWAHLFCRPTNPTNASTNSSTHKTGCTLSRRPAHRSCGSLWVQSQTRRWRSGGMEGGSSSRVLWCASLSFLPTTCLFGGVAGKLGAGWADQVRRWLQVTTHVRAGARPTPSNTCCQWETATVAEPSHACCPCTPGWRLRPVPHHGSRHLHPRSRVL